MEFLDRYLSVNNNIKPTSDYGFVDWYKYWKNYLLERSVKLFEWRGTYEVPPHEIEIPLLLGGCAGITDKYKGKLSAYQGWYAGGPTQYYDVYENMSIHSPVYSAILKIDRDVVLIRNNALMNSIMPLIHMFAVKLAHIDTSFITALINGRDNGDIPVVTTNAQIKEYEKYRNNLCLGIKGAMYSPAFSTIKFNTVNNQTTLNIMELQEVEENVLNAYYAAIGVKTAWNKKGNMINEEVEANNSMLLLNIHDMLEQRQKGCEKVNELYGTNWSVDLSPEIKMIEEGKADDDDTENAGKDSKAE